MATAPGTNILQQTNGISAFASVDETSVRITLSEAIAEDEFHFVAGGGEHEASWVDETHFDIVAEPDEPIHFLVFRIIGGSFESPAIAPPPP